MVKGLADIADQQNNGELARKGAVTQNWKKNNNPLWLQSLSTLYRATQPITKEWYQNRKKVKADIIRRKKQFYYQQRDIVKKYEDTKIINQIKKFIKTPFMNLYERFLRPSFFFEFKNARTVQDKVKVFVDRFNKWNPYQRSIIFLTLQTAATKQQNSLIHVINHILLSALKDKQELSGADARDIIKQVSKLNYTDEEEQDFIKVVSDQEQEMLLREKELNSEQLAELIQFESNLRPTQGYGLLGFIGNIMIAKPIKTIYQTLKFPVTKLNQLRKKILTQVRDHEFATLVQSVEKLKTQELKVQTPSLSLIENATPQYIIKSQLGSSLFQQFIETPLRVQINIHTDGVPYLTMGQTDNTTMNIVTNINESLQPLKPGSDDPMFDKNGKIVVAQPILNSQRKLQTQVTQIQVPLINVDKAKQLIKDDIKKEIGKESVIDLQKPQENVLTDIADGVGDIKQRGQSQVGNVIRGLTYSTKTALGIMGRFLSGTKTLFKAIPSSLWSGALSFATTSMTTGSVPLGVLSGIANFGTGLYKSIDPTGVTSLLNALTFLPTIYQGLNYLWDFRWIARSIDPEFADTAKQYLNAWSDENSLYGKTMRIGHDLNTIFYSDTSIYYGDSATPYRGRASKVFHYMTSGEKFRNQQEESARLFKIEQEKNKSQNITDIGEPKKTQEEALKEHNEQLRKYQESFDKNEQDEKKRIQEEADIIAKMVEGTEADLGNFAYNINPLNYYYRVTGVPFSEHVAQARSYMYPNNTVQQETKS